MKKAALFILLLLAMPVCAKEPPVLYGERNLADNKPALFFDREGTLYPDYRIPNDKLIENNTSLRQYYKNNVADFIAIAHQYRLDLKDSSDINISLLNAAVQSKEVAKINNVLVAGQSVTFLIHGFRKPFTPMNGDSSSVEDYDVMKKAVSPSVTTSFVEVYWDGNYDLRASKSGAFNGDNTDLLLLFEATQANAEAVGTNLKKVITQTTANVINVVTHSLGARVAAYALFNADKSNDSTPSQSEVNILLVAPAIGADLIYDNFAKRNTRVPYTVNDNYKLTIVYNEKDFVLRKRVGVFGPGAFCYGNTSLGCNKRDAAVELQSKIKVKYPNASITIKDFTDLVYKNHLVAVYFKASHFSNQLNGILK